VYDATPDYDGGVRRRGSRWIIPALVVVVALGLVLATLNGARPAPSGAPGTSGSSASSASTSGSLSSPSGSAATVAPTGSGGAVGSDVPTVTWSRRAPDGPIPAARQGHTWTVDPDTGIAYLYGGLTEADSATTGAALGDLWAYDLGADRWARVPVTGRAPEARWGHTAAWIDGVGLVIVGGRNSAGGGLDDSWRYDPDTASWQRLRDAGRSPPARSESCGVVDRDGALWLFDGRGTAGEALQDVWRYRPDPGIWELADLGPGAPARMDHACWLGPDGRVMVLGGEAGGTFFGDLWRIDLGAAAGGSWSQVPIGDDFGVRSRAAAATHADRGVIVGGFDADATLLDSAWSFGSDSISELASGETRPDGRARAALIDDPAAERMLLFGGVTASGVSDELWQAVLR
jgi:hypothetical protein